jgi:hypothetical protein
MSVRLQCISPSQHCWPLSFVLVLGLSQTMGLLAACASSRIDPELRQLANGNARVIVEIRLDTPFVAEGRLPGSEAISAQRHAIEAAQDRVLSALHGTRFVLAHRYATVPFLALMVGRDALTILERRDDLVARVTRDTEARPTPVPAPTR